MKAHKATPLPSVDDTEEARQSEIAAEDRKLAAELAELRRRRDAGELVDTGEYL